MVFVCVAFLKSDLIKSWNDYLVTFFCTSKHDCDIHHAGSPSSKMATWRSGMLGAGSPSMMMSCLVTSSCWGCRTPSRNAPPQIPLLGRRRDLTTLVLGQAQQHRAYLSKVVFSGQQGQLVGGHSGLAGLGCQNTLAQPWANSFRLLLYSDFRILHGVIM